MRWFGRAAPPADVHVRSAASTLTGFSIAGPNARSLMQRLVREDLSSAAFKLFSVKETAVGMSPAILSRAGFTGELGYEVWVTPDFQETLHDEIFEAGRDLGLAWFGGRALSSLRLEKGYGSFNKDFRPDYTPAETGLDAFVDFSKSGFTGRDAASAERAIGPKKRFAVLEVETDTDVIGYEPILKDGAVVGHVTSGGFGHWVGRSIALGFVPSHLANDGEEFRIDIFGQDCPAILRKAPLHDPNGGRLRG
jgi:dimethylglycine dehydrogenase